MSQLTKEDIDRLLAEAEIITEQICAECEGYSCGTYPICEEEDVA